MENIKNLNQILMSFESTVNFYVHLHENWFYLNGQCWHTSIVEIVGDSHLTASMPGAHEACFLTAFLSQLWEIVAWSGIEHSPRSEPLQKELLY